MPKNLLQGQFIVSLSEGDIIPVTSVLVNVDSITLESNGVQTKIDPLMLKNIYEVSPSTSPEDILSRAETNEEHITLTKTLCGVLELEDLLRKFYEDTKTVPQKIALFGSSSLTLTILPGRSSHDVDVATSSKFSEFCQTRGGKSHGNYAEVSSLHLLNYLGQWEERASGLRGVGGTQMLLLHPLDTVMQKLLRRDQNRFKTNDIPDIEKVLDTLRPTQETLQFLLTENPSRYRIPKHKEQWLAIEKNTTWFLNRFLKGITLKDISELSEKKEEQYLVEKGFAPNPLPNQDLGKLVRKIQVNPKEFPSL